VCSQGRTSPCGADAILSPVCGGGGGLWSMLIIYAQFLLFVGVWYGWTAL